MRLDPARLIVLDAVAHAGGVQAAARRLHLVPSGVSQHLAALERETGLTLVDRSRRGGPQPLTLTAAGRRLAQHAERLVAVLHDAEQDLSDYLGEVRGIVRLSAFTTALPALVLPALAAVRDTHPGIRPIVSDVEGGEALSALVNDELDLFLVEMDAGKQPSSRRLTVVPLLSDPYLVAVPADWPRPQSLADLAGRPWIGAPPGSATARTLERLRGESGLELTETHSALEFPAVLALVGGGFGAALVPRLALHGDQRIHGQVVNLPQLGDRTIAAAHSAARPLRPAVRIVLNALRAAADQQVSAAPPP